MEVMYQYLDINGNGVAEDPCNYPLVHDKQTQTTRYDCFKCDSRFTSRQYLHAHEVEAHNRVFHCPLCPSLFSNKADFQIHTNAHTERLLPCPMCSKVFFVESDYKAHMKEHQMPKFPCDLCPAWFDQYSMLRKHCNDCHVQKKFVHNVPKITKKKYSSKKLLKKVRQELDFVSEMTGVEHPADSELIDSAQVNSAPTSSVASVTVSLLDTNGEPDNDVQVFEPNEKNSRQCGHSSKKKTKLASDATTSTGSVSSAPDSSSGKIGAHQSSKKPMLKKKNVLKRKQNLPKKAIESVAELSAPSTSNECIEEDSSTFTGMNSERRLRPRNLGPNFYREELINSDDEIELPLRNPDSDERSSGRNLLLRNTVTKSNQGSSPTKTNAIRNLRRRAEKKDAVRHETSEPTNNETGKPTSNCSNLAIGCFMCLSCKRLFRTYRLLYQHKELHIQNRGLRCNGCGGLFGGASNLASHQQSSLCDTT